MCGSCSVKESGEQAGYTKMGGRKCRQVGVREMQNMVWRLWRDENGATSIEYALIASFIGIAIVVSVTAVGTSVSGVFDDVAAGF